MMTAPSRRGRRKATQNPDLSYRNFLICAAAKAGQSLHGIAAREDLSLKQVRRIVADSRLFLPAGPAPLAAG